MNKYEDPTQRLTSHNWSEEYKDNYEAIFGKKETWLERRIREEKEALAKENDDNSISGCGHCGVPKCGSIRG